MSKRVDQLIPLTDTQVNDDTKLWPVGVGATGFLNRATTAQMKKVFSTQPTVYKTTGGEGSTLSIPEIAGKNVLAIFREGSLIYPVDATPDPAEYIWDSTNITLGTPVNPMGGERFLILYKNN